MQITETKRATPIVLTVFFVTALLLAAMLTFSSHASAATLNKVFVRFDRMKISQATTGTVCASPTTVASTEGKVLVTFPAGYTLGLAATFTTSTTNLAWPTFSGYTTTAWPSIATATNVTGQVVTFPSGDLTSATNLYCFNWSSNTAVANPSSASANLAGSVATETGASAAIDSGSFTTAAITDDQIQVSASVSQTFSFSLSGNSDALGALASGSVSSSPTPRVATVSTNAKNGWDVWAQDLNTGLNSPTAAYTIASTTPGSNSTLSAGTEGYNTGVVSSPGTGSGTVTVATPFVGGSTGKGGGLNTSLALLASSNGSNSGATLTLTNNAAINGATAAAGDYADTITVVGAGLF